MEREKASKPGRPVSKEELAVAAYFHWLNRGCPINDDLTDWIEAEKEYERESRPAKGKKRFENY